MQDQSSTDDEFEQEDDGIPYGFCHCGCGERTGIMQHTDPKRGRVAGEPYRYVFGHQSRGVYPDPMARFWEFIEPNRVTGCWEWTGTCNQGGYGLFTTGKQHYFTHRFSWTLHYGPIPDGLLCLHRCDNPPCVNPEHLFLGTHADNCADKIAKGRSRPARGEQNPNALLNTEKVIEIRALYATGDWTYLMLADLYGVAANTIGFVVTRVSWRHIP